MTVKELIDQLSNYNPEQSIRFEDAYEQYYLVLKIYQCPFNSDLVIISSVQPDDEQ